MKYLNRISDEILKARLQATDAILVEGPKWCGKTTTASQVANSILYMQQPETLEMNKRLAEIDPSALLDGKTPRLIDEWQLAPKLWDAVRFESDMRQKFGQFILTGSTVPPDKTQINHTGTGRIGRLHMRTMSLFESNDSTGDVSLKELFESGRRGKNSKTITNNHACNNSNIKIPIVQNPCSSIEALTYLTARGGWPRSVGQKSSIALQQVRTYLDAIAEIDISAVDGVDRSPEFARSIMRSYSRYISSQGKISQMIADLELSDKAPGEYAVRSYLEALQKLFVIEELPAWNPNLRSKSAIRTTPVRHFVDPSIAVAALGTSPKGLMEDIETFGLLFESMCVRDLRCYADALDAYVSHYRDSSGLECDAVVHLRDGKYGLIEVKLGGDSLIDEGAKNLKKLSQTINTKKMGYPSFLMVLAGTTKMSYPREDGVLVVPIACLGP